MSKRKKLITDLSALTGTVEVDPAAEAFVQSGARSPAPLAVATTPASVPAPTTNGPAKQSVKVLIVTEEDYYMTKKWKGNKRTVNLDTTIENWVEDRVDEFKRRFRGTDVKPPKKADIYHYALHFDAADVGGRPRAGS